MTTTQWNVQNVADEVVLTLPILNDAMFVVKGDNLVVSLTPDQADRMADGLRLTANAARPAAQRPH